MGNKYLEILEVFSNYKRPVCTVKNVENGKNWKALNKYIFRAFLCTIYHSRHWATEVNDAVEFSALMGKTTKLYNC